MQYKVNVIKCIHSFGDLCVSIIFIISIAAT